MERGTSYFGVRDVDHVTEDLDRFRDEGLNAIVHTFSEQDQHFYGDTMAEIVEESADRGFTVYVNPWGVGKVFGGETFSRFLAKHPESRQRTVTGERVYGACFNDPTFRSFMREWTRDAVDLGPDVLFWDEPHWFVPDWFGDDLPDDGWVCRCEHCKERYEERYDRVMPSVEDESVEQFREDSLLEFLDELMAIGHDAGVDNAVCLVPVSDADHGIANWERLAEREHVDVFATDPYWELFPNESVEEFVRDSADRIGSLAETHDLESQLWIQGFGLDDDPESYEAVRTATRTAVESGVDSVFVWGYDGCRSISSISSEDPMRVWETYLDALPET
ncbi:hypothetical protein [Halomontanus rarus]|uniref:hypothetical protein n=1 Tax=Halomontanus rarus TaxID=3034020 RepID=UPI0023E8D033|nr:hypothetical protein [Halovivax sp. TS33]